MEETVHTGITMFFVCLFGVESVLHIHSEQTREQIKLFAHWIIPIMTNGLCVNRSLLKTLNGNPIQLLCNLILRSLVAGVLQICLQDDEPHG